MASFDINFNANTTGDHYVGYRTDGDPWETYTVITINVVTPGLQSATIPVIGNVYCIEFGLTYTGYVIAACQDQTDTDMNGIPDNALTWSVDLVQQTDPCIKTRITCESVPIASVTIDNDGTANCAPDGTYALTITEASVGDEVVAADIDATVAGGIVTGIVINNGGLYKNPPNISHIITGPCDTNPVFTAVLDTTCPSIDVTDYACADSTTLSGDSDYTLFHTQPLVICADIATLVGLPQNFLTEDVVDISDSAHCHCEECKNITIEATGATTGVGTITYQTCWDDSNPAGTVQMVTMNVNWNDGVLDLGCVLVNTIITDQGTLDQSISIVTNSICS